MQAMGVDIGGSGIKGASVDLLLGQLSAPRLRIPTPEPSTPEQVMGAVRELITQHAWNGPIGITIPGVVHEGEVRTAANIDKSWIDDCTIMPSSSAASKYSGFSTWV